LSTKIVPSKQIKSLISHLKTNLLSDGVNERKEAARNLILLARKTPHCIKEIWKDVESIIKKTHDDKWESTGNNSDCTSRHKDNGGIGLAFPPFPFANK
jgi:hypothetical protein